MSRGLQPSQVFRAFADPTRLRILSLLVEHKDLCVCDLCAALGEVQPKVSRHLGILRRAGLVEVHREGKWKFYSVAEPPTSLQRTLLRCVRSCLSGVDELAADRVRMAGLELRRRCA
jgi:ArsR family transcriptional regulator